MPERIQRKRVKGWRMPEGAVYVGRPTKWGNPFTRRIEDAELLPFLVHPVDPNRSRILSALSTLHAVFLNRQQMVDAYGWWVIQQPVLMLGTRELAGKDLACWCPLDEPCHADVLLELANSDFTWEEPVEHQA